MKILQVLFSLSSGGAERFTVDLSNELAKTNEVILMTIKDDKINSDERLFYKFDLSDKVKYLNLGLPDGFNLTTEIKIYKAIKNLSPDIVHFQGASLPKFCFFAIMMLCRKIKFFQTVHNDLHNGYDYGVNKLLFKTFGRIGLMHYAALSETNYNDLTAFYPNSDIRCIVNGRAAIAKTEEFDVVKNELEKYRSDDFTKLFIHIARCHKDKNQQLLINTFNRLIKEGRNIALVILGANFDSVEGMQLKALANSNIHFLGTRKNVGDYLLNSDVFILSSLFEGMPITLLEASLAGIPVVSTPVCGAVDMIKDGINGKLSADFSLDSYVEAINYVIDHYDELKVNSEAMKGESPYTIEKCAKKYVEYYSSKMS